MTLSNKQEFSEAKKEWVLVGFKLKNDFDKCPCGKRIKELCYIKNKETDKKTYVGNVCVNIFIGIETGNLFDGLKRINKDILANANEDLIEHAYKCGYLYSKKEYDFLMEIRLKKKLSRKQIDWKVKINRRIINETVVQRH
ncbi:hypothetical protein [Bathymodiolus japonicus methanotrophic gill symbiont]|uniref:hypothetical protein n=1 Tax=Bathymodiolus japonicus methanotrophic gill symbiont TaxID=113269 RepID=UPI001E442D6C|nr:hypothetical protein [Bathymodiolus japonicus methanotrophic gill symbiont]